MMRLASMPGPLVLQKNALAKNHQVQSRDRPQNLLEVKLFRRRPIRWHLWKHWLTYRSISRRKTLSTLPVKLIRSKRWPLSKTVSRSTGRSKPLQLADLTKVNQCSPQITTTDIQKGVYLPNQPSLIQSKSSAKKRSLLRNTNLRSIWSPEWSWETAKTRTVNLPSMAKKLALGQTNSSPRKTEGIAEYTQTSRQRGGPHMRLKIREAWLITSATKPRAVLIARKTHSLEIWWTWSKRRRRKMGRG